MNLFQALRRALILPRLDFTTLDSWRQHVLSVILLFVVFLGAMVAVPSVLIALSEGMWQVAVFDLLALVWVSMLWRSRTLSLQARAWNFCALLYLLGVALWLTVGSTSEVYLMAFPVMAALLLGLRPAIFALGLNAFTMVAVGYLSEGHALGAGFQTQALLRWIVIGLNFSLVNSMMTLSIVVMLQGLEKSLTRVRESEELHRATFENAPIGVSRIDLQGHWLQANPKLCEITGFSQLEMSQLSVKDITHPQDLALDLATVDALLHSDADSLDREKRYRHKDGHYVWVQVRTSLVRQACGEPAYFVAVTTDVTESKDAQAKINDLAFFDQLTGLPNRTLLLDRLNQTMAASVRDCQCGALIYIDLDHFKTLNDTLGHETGDLLLQQVAQRLSGCVRQGDSVARLGGDEFMVMLVGIRSIDDAAARAEMAADEILSTLNQPYQLRGVTHHSSPSVGVTLFSGQGVAGEELMKQADLAMHRSKLAGRNAVHFFDPTMQAVVMERAGLEHDLRQAIEAQQFLLHYQAKVGRDGHLTGVEALVRWQHPVRGMVSPAEFIPLAEETGLILPLGQWVMQTACEQLAAWASRPEMAHLTVAVNVSAREFQQADFVKQVTAVLQRTGADPRRLRLELTESLLIANIEEVIGKMVMLKAIGVGFELDDFGTGYSSLSYLKRLPLDQLKIDQSFVRDVLSDPNDAAIARTVVALAQSLGLGVIAEGVETAAQRDFLDSLGCHAYQGYFFSRPLPIDRFEIYARDSRASA